VKTFDELKALIEKRGVHPEFGEPGESWGIEQNSFELATFLVRMQELNVQSALEIGTGYKGGLSRFLAHDMGWDVTTYDVQNYGHVFTGVHYITGNGLLNIDKQFDLVFIDGDHSYDSVKWDYAKYTNLMLKATAFHDIAGLRGCEGVSQLWTEIKQSPLSLKSGEIIAPAKQSGIGWIEL
jgi:hypothetical protein